MGEHSVLAYLEDKETSSIPHWPDWGEAKISLEWATLYKQPVPGPTSSKPPKILVTELRHSWVSTIFLMAIGHPPLFFLALRLANLRISWGNLKSLKSLSLPYVTANPPPYLKALSNRYHGFSDEKTEILKARPALVPAYLLTSFHTTLSRSLLSNQLVLLVLAVLSTRGPGHDLPSLACLHNALDLCLS